MSEFTYKETYQLNLLVASRINVISHLIERLKDKEQLNMLNEELSDWTRIQQKLKTTIRKHWDEK